MLCLWYIVFPTPPCWFTSSVIARTSSQVTKGKTVTLRPLTWETLVRLSHRTLWENVKKIILDKQQISEGNGKGKRREGRKISSGQTVCFKIIKQTKNSLQRNVLAKSCSKTQYCSQGHKLVDTVAVFALRTNIQNYGFCKYRERGLSRLAFHNWRHALFSLIDKFYEFQGV